MTTLIDADEPQIVTSPNSRVVIIDGWRFDVNIYRLDRDDDWALEVVDEADGSHVWDKTFASADVLRIRRCRIDARCRPYLPGRRERLSRGVKSRTLPSSTSPALAGRREHDR